MTQNQQTHRQKGKDAAKQKKALTGEQVLQSITKKQNPWRKFSLAEKTDYIDHDLDHAEKCRRKFKQNKRYVKRGGGL